MSILSVSHAAKAPMIPSIAGRLLILVLMLSLFTCASPLSSAQAAIRTHAPPTHSSNARATTCPFTNVYGFIFYKWDALNRENGPLGCPTSNDDDILSGARSRSFEHGAIIWKAGTTAAYVLYDVSPYDIYHTWQNPLNGVQQILGYPTSDDNPSPDGSGRFARFEHGSLYWFPNIIGAWPLYDDAIARKWFDMGAEQSTLGYPESAEFDTTSYGRSGRLQAFQHGSIYWSPETGAHIVTTAFNYASSGVSGTLGDPVDDVKPTRDGVGQFQLHEHGAVYESPSTGIWPIVEPIYSNWQSLGGERGVLGYPTQYDIPSENHNHWVGYFQNGGIISENGAETLIVYQQGPSLTFQWKGLNQCNNYTILYQENSGKSDGYFHMQRGSVGTTTINKLYPNTLYSISMRGDCRLEGLGYLASVRVTTGNAPPVAPPVVPVPNPLNYANLRVEMESPYTRIEPNPYPDADTPFTVYFYLCNEGRQTIDKGFDITLVLDGGIQQTTTRFDQSLPPKGEQGQQGCGVAWWIFDNGLSAGEHSVGIVLDAKNEVPELTKGDNRSYMTVSVDTPFSMLTTENNGTLALRNNNVHVDFPAQAVTSDTSVTYTPIQQPTHQLPNTQDIALRSFSLNGYAADGTAVSQFQRPYTMTVHYDQAELVAHNVSADSLHIAFWNDQTTQWEIVPTTNDRTHSKITAQLDHFTEFVLLSTQAPTAITLTMFTASRENEHVRVSWTTSREHNIWSFDIYRSSTDRLEDAAIVTQSPIPAQGRGQEGASYSWVDTTSATGASSYWLAEIEGDGSRHFYGPVHVSPTVSGAPYTIFVPLMAQ